MLVPILFGVVVLAVVIGVWVYRGTRDKNAVDAVTGPEYDPGKVVTTAAEEQRKNNRTETFAASKTSTQNTGNTANHTHSVNKSADVNSNDKSEPEIGVYQETDVQKDRTQTPETRTTVNTGTTETNRNTGKDEKFEGSGVYSGSKETSDKDKQIVNTGLNNDSKDDDIREPEKHEEHSIQRNHTDPPVLP